jgi:hypothetical protein
VPFVFLRGLRGSALQFLERAHQIRWFRRPQSGPEIAHLSQSRLDRLDGEVLRCDLVWSSTSLHLSGVETPAKALARAL